MGETAPSPPAHRGRIARLGTSGDEGVPRARAGAGDGPGVRDGEGGTRITLVLDQHGPLAGLIRLLTQRKTRRYLHLEANGLKAAAES